MDDLPILCYPPYQLMLWNITMDTLLFNAIGAEIEIIVFANVTMIV